MQARHALEGMVASVENGESGANQHSRLQELEAVCEDGLIE